MMPLRCLRPFQPLLVIAAIVITAAGCDRRAEDWEYPVKLGDTRERVYDLIGPPVDRTELAPTAAIVELFPLSGVAIEFDPAGRAREIHIAGEYHLAGWIVSDRPVVFGLHARSTRVEFGSTFGEPALTEQGADAQTLTWRRAPYAVLAEFWTRDVVIDGKTLPAGSLRRMEVSAAQ